VDRASGRGMLLNVVPRCRLTSSFEVGRAKAKSSTTVPGRDEQGADLDQQLRVGWCVLTSDLSWYLIDTPGGTSRICTH
jgi:hypothetical protein